MNLNYYIKKKNGGKNCCLPILLLKMEVLIQLLLAYALGFSAGRRRRSALLAQTAQGPPAVAEVVIFPHNAKASLAGHLM